MLFKFKQFSRIIRNGTLFCCCLFCTFSYAQKKPTKIKLQHADLFEYIDRKGKKTRRLTGNVSFKHENVLMFCDSALLYPKTNALDAYGHVRIKQGGGITITGDSLHYNGNKKLADINGNVVLIHDKTILTTTAMTHNLATNSSIYRNGGKLVDADNTLTSIVGIYKSISKTFFFRDDVLLVNPKYTMKADTLEYSSQEDKAIFHGPTTIESEENTIYCEAGWYSTQSNLSEFSKRAKILTNEQSISGDSLFYDRDKGYGKGIGNVEIIDTAQNIIVKGHFGEYYEKEDIFLVTKDAVMIDIYEDDSLFLHADTLRSGFDSSGISKVLYAYHGVRFFKSDLQGKCDSIVFSYADSTIQLFVDPVIWSEENQMTADFVNIKRGDGGIESLDFQNNAFIVSQVDSIRYNQIKGKNMLGMFAKNELNKIKVKGNGETVYYARQEDSTFTGVNVAQCSDMMIYVNDNDITSITFINMPTAILHPIEKITPAELELKGFRWLANLRPRNKTDIFARD